MFESIHLQGKQESVLELLTRADAEASSQSKQHQLHSSMAETLAEAWKDLSHEMDLRQSLLDQNVAFHESAQQVTNAFVKKIHSI